MLSLSGQGGVFIQNLKKDVIKLPNVSWESPLTRESDLGFLKRLQIAGKEAKVPLAFRHGGGSWLGLIKADETPKAHSWSIFGVPWSWGPKSVLQLLEANGWKVEGLPRPPHESRKFWGFQGQHKPSGRGTFSYTTKLGNDELKRSSAFTDGLSAENFQGEPTRLTGARWWGAGMEDPSDPIEVSPSTDSQDCH